MSRPGRWGIALALLFGSGLTGCSSGETTDEVEPHLRYFGFVGTACGTDYTQEVAAFTNVATTCAPDPSLSDFVRDQLDVFESASLGALLNAEGIFFEPDSGGELGPYGGVRLALRADYEARWAALVESARLAARRDVLAAIFVVDEPTWRGVDPGELAAAFAAVEATFPEVPLLLVEAYPVLDQLVVPPSVDWVAFDRYGVLDPANDEAYLADLAQLKVQRSRPDQRVLLVMEAQWIPLYADFDVPPEALAGIAESYYRLAQRDTSVVGVVGYLWPSGLDDPGQLGARDLPAEVQDVYRRIGTEIVDGAR